MVFKWKISRPAFHAVVSGVDVMHAGIETEFETGSIGEAAGIFTDSGTALAQMFGSSLMANASGLALAIGGAGETTDSTETTGASVETEAERKKRERAEKRAAKNQPDPSTANAPEPMTIPGAEAPPTAPPNTDPGPNGIPAFLDRTGEAGAAAAATIAAPPAPPAPPPAPPAPPAPPPTGVLAAKIAADLDRRAAGSTDGGQALADWLATSGITVKGATYAEAVTVLRLQADEKLGPIAERLGIT